MGTFKRYALQHHGVTGHARVISSKDIFLHLPKFDLVFDAILFMQQSTLINEVCTILSSEFKWLYIQKRLQYKNKMQI